MRPERNVLITTVGISLFSNIEKLPSVDPLKKEKERANWIGLSKGLLEKSPADKVCGAEINSITSILNKNFLEEKEELYFLTSNTDEGKDTGEIFKRYYEDSKNPHRFKRVLIKNIEGLTDKDFKSFRNRGLKNLVKVIAGIVREKGSERLIINATGGYKAQISFAGLIGQALEIPVMYMFESFSEVISLPPQPLSFNYDLWFDHYEKLERLYSDTIDIEEVLPLTKDERMTVLIDEEEIDEKRYASLSPVGCIFHEGFKYRFLKERKTLLPPDLRNHERKEPQFSSHFQHTPPLLAKERVKKIWREKKYIKTIYDFEVNPDLPGKEKFNIDEYRQKIIYTYSDGTRTARFNIEIDEPSSEKLKRIFIDLNETYIK